MWYIDSAIKQYLCIKSQMEEAKKELQFIEDEAFNELQQKISDMGTSGSTPGCFGSSSQESTGDVPE